jgi:hypothetical protein
MVGFVDGKNNPRIMLMKSIFFLLLLVQSVFAAAIDNECVFDQSAQIEYLKQYVAQHQDAKLTDPEKGIKITRENEVIHFNRGGCMDFGVSIESISSIQYTEEQFLQKVLMLVDEFGKELVSIDALKSAFDDEKWEQVDGVYSVSMENLASFEMQYDKDGRVYVGFYMN